MEFEESEPKNKRKNDIKQISDNPATNPNFSLTDVIIKYIKYIAVESRTDKNQSLWNWKSWLAKIYTIKEPILKKAPVLNTISLIWNQEIWLSKLKNFDIDFLEIDWQTEDFFG